jgi:hypothetical protein
MNPLKQEYPFVDLLKPETSAVVPLLLALSPRHRKHAVDLVPLKLRERRLRPEHGARLRNARPPRRAARHRRRRATRGSPLARE